MSSPLESNKLWPTLHSFMLLITEFTLSTRVNTEDSPLAFNWYADCQQVETKRKISKPVLFLISFFGLIFCYIQLRDPVVILLDEPTGDLDPLHTYMVVSILSNHAKKYNRIVVLSTEKPRSDIFPFLDRVTYLCLGDVVYTGATRMMLDYFRHLGFPCPELENPLMFYLCLSTVDRRSQERFLESSNQIAALVDKFRMDGRPFRKCAVSYADHVMETEHRLPLTAYGRPTTTQVLTNLMSREWAVLWNCGSPIGRNQFFLRLLLLPVFFFLLWIFYYDLPLNQQSYASRNGLLYSCLAGTMFLSVASTVAIHPALRTRYYQESRDGFYFGPSFILARSLASLPLSTMTVAAASAIIYFGMPISTNPFQYLLFGSTLWAVHYFMEQQTMALLMLIKSSFNAALTSLFLGIVYLNVGSAMVRAIPGLPDYLYYLTYVTQSRYAAAVLNEQHFRNFSSLPSVLNATLSIPCPSGTTFSNYGNIT